MRTGLGITETIVTGHILLVVCGLETLQLFCSSCIIMNDVNLNLHLSTQSTQHTHIYYIHERSGLCSCTIYTIYIFPRQFLFCPDFFATVCDCLFVVIATI